MLLNMLYGMRQGDIKFKSFFEQYVTATQDIFKLKLKEECSYEKDLEVADAFNKQYIGKFKLVPSNYKNCQLLPGKSVYDEFLIKVKNEEVELLNMTTHPVEFSMYYSC